MSEGLSPFERLQKPSIEKVLAYAEQNHSQEVIFYNHENLSNDEKKINRIYDDMATNIKDQVDAFGADPRGEFNEDILRGYVASLDLIKRFSEGTTELKFNRGAFEAQQARGDEFYRFDAIDFKTIAGRFSAKVEIHPQNTMESKVRDDSGNSQQRIRFEVVPIDPTITLATQIRVDIGGGHVVYDYHAYHPESETVENIIDRKAPYLDQFDIHLEGLSDSPDKKRHHQTGSRIVEKSKISELRPTFERILRKFESRARSLDRAQAA